jgi:hypothetical protein
MSLSRIAFGTFAVIGVGVLGCSIDSSKPGQITFKTQTRYVNAPDTSVEATKDWTGEEISIVNDSLSVLVNGGTEVVGDASVKRVKVTARVVAYADAEDRASADKSIADAIKTVVIDESGGKISVKCGHGGSYGSSDAGKSGCEYLTVRVPAGDATKPVKVTIGAGNGDLKVSGIVGSVSASTKNGDTTVSVTPAKGSTISATGDAATVSLPASFAADMITLSVASGSKGKVVTTDFPDVTSGKGRGNAGEGAASITVSAQGPFDDDNATLKKQ